MMITQAKAHDMMLAEVIPELRAALLKGLHQQEGLEERILEFGTSTINGTTALIELAMDELYKELIG